MPTLIQLLKSRTILFSLLLAMLSVMQGYIGVFNLTPTNQMLAGIAIAAAIAVLRFVTTQPLGQK